MLIDDAEYFLQRALSEVKRAATAGDDRIASVHLRLSNLLLQHARALVAWKVDEPHDDMARKQITA